MPGVGAFPRAMDNLRELGLDELLRERVAAGTPVLGICLGMQLAFDYSTEHGGAAGLGIIAGEVRALDAGALKLPHIGWNEVRFAKTRVAARRGPAAASAPSTTCTPSRPSPLRPRTSSARPTTARRSSARSKSGSFYGVQFHPEKSSAAGLRLLANFARICTTARVLLAT